MINDLLAYLQDKNILILGFGTEGQSSYKLIRKYFPHKHLTISDRQENFQEKQEMLSEDTKVKYLSGENYLEQLNEYDLILKSPGISLKNKNIEKILPKLKSQMELLLEFIPVYTIGITGTKGKSTTSSLLYQILEDQGKEPLLLGNIGIPVFDYLDVMHPNQYIVLEMSSHQLEYMKKSPNIAIFLNLYEEHLDHYLSLEKYGEAKQNIYRYQTQEDYFIYNQDNKWIQKAVERIKAKGHTYKISYQGDSKSNMYRLNTKIYTQDNKELYDTAVKRKLLGEHNANNLMFALEVSKILKLDLEKTKETINNFDSLPHRLELVGTNKEITYYNDSIATIPEATISAIKTLGKVDTLLIGGMDRGIDFSEFIQYLNNSSLSNIICMPTTGTTIGKSITNKMIKVFQVSNLQEAVTIAKKETSKNGICLLSPAAASYGYFKNFKERGEEFKRLVKE